MYLLTRSCCHSNGHHKYKQDCSYIISQHKSDSNGLFHNIKYTQLTSMPSCLQIVLVRKANSHSLSLSLSFLPLFLSLFYLSFFFSTSCKFDSPCLIFSNYLYFLLLIYSFLIFCLPLFLLLPLTVFISFFSISSSRKQDQFATGFQTCGTAPFNLVTSRKKVSRKSLEAPLVKHA